MSVRSPKAKLDRYPFIIERVDHRLRRYRGLFNYRRTIGPLFRRTRSPIQRILFDARRFPQRGGPPVGTRFSVHDVHNHRFLWEISSPFVRSTDRYQKRLHGVQIGLHGRCFGSALLGKKGSHRQWRVSIRGRADTCWKYYCWTKLKSSVIEMGYCPSQCQYLLHRASCPHRDKQCIKYLEGKVKSLLILEIYQYYVIL